MAELDADMTSYDDAGIPLDNEFSYFMIAISSNFTSAPSDTVEISLLFPESPNDLSSSISKLDGIIMSEMNWEKTDNITDDFVLYESSNKIDYLAIDTLAESSFTKILEEGDLLYYYVISRNEFGVSDPSDTIEVDATKPAPPSFTLTYENATGQVIIDWTLPQGRSDSLIVYQSLDNEEFEAIDSLKVSDESYSVDVMPDTLYFYYLKGRNIIGDSDQSETKEISTYVLGVNQNGSLYTVYPNPSSDGKITIDLNGEVIDRVSVIDLSGQVLQSKMINSRNLNLDLSQYPNGQYLIRMFRDGDEVNTMRLLKK